MPIIYDITAKDSTANELKLASEMQRLSDKEAISQNHINQINKLMEHKIAIRDRNIHVSLKLSEGDISYIRSRGYTVHRQTGYYIISW